MKKKALAALLCMALTTGLVAGCAGQPESSGSTSQRSSEQPSGNKTPETVKIGLMVSLTGNGVQAGEECRALAEIFEDIINNKHEGVSLPFAEEEGLPNLGGAKVKFVVGDQSMPDIALNEAERLITQEKVIGFCGNFSSATTKTVMVPAEKYRCIVLSEGTSNTLNQAGYKYYGRSFPGDDLFIQNTFEYLDDMNKTQNAGIKKIALVSEDSEFGTNIGKVEMAAAEKFGYEVVENISYSSIATNVTSEVLRLKKANPDAVIMSSYATDALLFMSTFKEQNYFPKMLFGQRGGFMASDFTQNLGTDSDYVLTTSRWNSDMNNKAAQTIAKLFKDKTGITLLGDTLTSVWDGVVLAALANQAGSTDADAIRAVMAEGLQLDPADDPFALEGYKYAENGQNEHGNAIIVQYKDMVLSTVYPKAGASRETLYPAKAWNER